MPTPIHITAFYHFTPLTEQELGELQKKLFAYGEKTDMRGLTILAKEGMNGTVSGSKEAIEGWKKLLQGDITFKDSSASEQPFNRWFIKIRDEIVTLKDTSVVPKEKERNHLSPTEWHTIMQEDDVIVIDARNTYETAIGMFKGALDPKLDHFHQFPDYVRKSGIPKEKKVLMYCTGGIRCEKALLEMEKQGYEHVYQLEGGILKYLEEYPHELFEGECFVFDHRASVDQELRPSSQYALCPHCGDPGKERIACKRCGEAAVVCEKCLAERHKEACSKDCANRIEKSIVHAEEQRVS